MARLAPDTNDILVWKLEETSGAYRNSGTILPNNTSTDLNVFNTIDRNGTGIYGGPCANFPGTSNFPAGSSATRNYAVGGSTISPQPPLTVSAWVYLRNYNNASSKHVVGKLFREHTVTNNWAAPFFAIEISMTTGNSGMDLYFATAVTTSSQTGVTITDFPIPIQQWAHIGFTHDGSFLRCYLNGCQLMTYTGATQNLQFATASSIVYNDANPAGGWVIGAVPPYLVGSSSNKEEANYMVQDVRVAGVVRNLNYFQSVYKTGVLPINLSPLVQYYKLRVYDTSCITPTPVVWVDTQISLTNVPSFPCSGPYSPIEVLDTWYQ